MARNALDLITRAKEFTTTEQLAKEVGEILEQYEERLEALEQKKNGGK